MATARERARAGFTADLLEAARSRLADEGASALSLRAIARDLGVASSAVYRYVESRDALLTLLIVEAYDESGRVCEEACAAALAAGATPAEAWLAVARAFREWARGNRHSYELVYGTPVPGYAAPSDTVGPAMRLWGVIVGLVLDAHADGSLRPAGPDVDPEGLVEPGPMEFAAALAAEPRRAEALAGREPWGPVAAGRSFTLFTSLLGAVTAELFGHLHGVAADLGRVFDLTIATAAAGAGLHVDPSRLDPGPASRAGR